MRWLNGRWPRIKFNLTLLGVIATLFVFVEILNYFGKFGETPLLLWFAPLFVFVINIGLVLISVLRLHDLNLSGWWCLIGFIPYVNLLFFVLLMAYPSAKGPYRFAVNEK